jgi:hypothetical protein
MAGPSCSAAADGCGAGFSEESKIEDRKSEKIPLLSSRWKIGDDLRFSVFGLRFSNMVLGVIHALVILALGWTQANDTVTRNDPNRTAYSEALEAYAQAEKLMGASPEAALEKLAPIIADSRLMLIEQRIFIYNKAQEPTKHDFYPYHLRGTARLLVARKHKDEEARQLLIDAIGDLRTSVGRKADRSKEPLANAHKELWENIRGALSYEGWKPGATRLVDQALALIAETDHSKEASDWLADEIGRVETHLRGLRRTIADLDARRSPAAVAADWCEKVVALVKGIPAFQAVLSVANKTHALAVSIRDSKGTFRLKIGVSPWAKIERLERAGEEIQLADRETPLLVPQELEIDNYTIELVHENSRKNARIDAISLQPGRTYVLWGDMNGDKFQLSELTK